MSKRNQIAMSAKGRRSALMLSAAAIAVVSLGAGAAAAQTPPAPDTLPTGGTFVGGTGTVTSGGPTTTNVNQSTDRGVVNWATFDVGENATVNFFQPDSSSLTINRVTGGGDMSQIYGTINANGTIAILNPNGVIFGGTAHVDVGGLIASTGDIDIGAVMGGGPLSFTGATAGMIDVLGGAEISIANAGLAAFVAPHVRNGGTITAVGGSVSLGAGETFTLDLAGDGLIELGVPTNSPLVENYGSIIAQGGRIQLSAAAASAVVGNVINTSGVLQVGSAVESDGVIILEASSGDIQIGADISGGDVTITGDRIHGAGDIDTGGELTLNVNTSQIADTTAGNWIADALGVIGAVAGGSTVNLGAGDYAAGANVTASNVTLDGQGGATIVVDGTPLAGLTISGDGVTVQNLAIDGPVVGDQVSLDWSLQPSTVGIVVNNGAENATVTGNQITNLRTGIRMHGGGNAGAVVSNNFIENTKGAILVQYTDGAGLDIFGNSQGPLGNEWGIVLNLNTGTPLNQHATTDAQANIIGLSEDNNGFTVMDRAYAWSNRSHVWVDDDSTVTPADDFDYGNGLGNERQALHTVQAGIIAVAAGGTVIVNDGTYIENVLIDKAGVSLLSVNGRDATTIQGVAGTGRLGAIHIAANANDFTLGGVDQGFTIIGFDSASAGIENAAVYFQGANSGSTVAGNRITANGDGGLMSEYGAVVSNLTIDGNIFDGQTFVGSNPAGSGFSQQFSLHNVPRQLVVVGGGNGGGNTSNVTFTNNQVTGIAGGLNGSSQEQGNTLVTIDSVGATITGNTFAGTTTRYGNQLRARGTNTLISGNTFDNTNMGAATSPLYVRNSVFGAGQADFATMIGDNTFIGQGAWADSSGTGFHSFTMSIQGAVNEAASGATVSVLDGTYNETVSITRGLTLSGAGMDDTTITGGILLSGTFSDLTLEGFTVRGDAGSNTVIRGGSVTNLTVDGVRIDGDSVAGRFGFVGGQYSGDISITNSEFLNIRGWAAFDTRSGAGGANDGTNITSAVFSNNLLDNTAGHIAFRHQTGATPYPDVTIANNTVTNVGDSTLSFGAIFKAFRAGAVNFTGNNVSDVGISSWTPAGEATYGAVLMVRAADVLNVAGNTFTNNNQVFAVEPGMSLPGVTTFTNNTFTNNTYSIYLPTNVSGGGTITFGAGNNFVSGVDTVQHIVWRSSADLDLTGVEFDGLLGSEMTEVELFALEDMITHGTDADGAGLALINADNVYVTQNSGSIQRGVNAAGAGFTVNVGDGTYNEHVVVNTADLTLRSATQYGAIIDAGGTGIGISISGAHGDLGEVTIDGFTVQNWNTGGINQGMGAADFATVHVVNNNVIGPVGGSTSHGNGIQVSGDGSTVTNNTVSGAVLNSADWAGSGILVVNGSNITVAGNTVSGSDFGIGVMNYNNGGGMTGIVIDGNNVSGAVWDAITVQVYGGPIGDVSILNNTLHDNANGVGVWDYGPGGAPIVTITGNDFADNQSHVASNFAHLTVDGVLGSNTFDRTVHAAGGTTIYGDLSFAVSDATAGSDLVLSGDIFVEDDQILIDRDLTLTGQDGTIVQAGRNFTGSAPANAWWLIEEDVNFSLTGLAIDGSGFSITNAVRNHGHTTIDDVSFSNIVHGAYGGVAIGSFGGSVAGGFGGGTWANSSLTVTNSDFNNIGRIAVLVKGTGATADIIGNSFIGKGDGNHLDYAVEVGASGTANIIGNIITGNTGVAANDGSTSAGILVTSYYGGASTAVIEGNVVTGNTTGIHVGYDGSDVSSVTARSNDLSGNDFGLALTSTSATADASGNWFGTDDEASILAYMGGDEGGSVDFSTYLTSGADTDAAGGFQGDFSDLGVTALGGQTGAGDRIQEGVDFATDGGTVNVGGGTFALNGTLNIDRSVSLVGAGQGATLIDGSAINGYGMLVEADDVSLSGFTFQGNNSTSSSHYGIKVQPDTGDASDRVHNFSITDVTIQGWGGTELDLNGVVGAMIDGVTADGQGTKGVGIALTDSADVTIVNSTTLNNLWGSVALYQTNRFYDQQLTDIHIDANANSFGEDIGVFAQSYSDIGLEIGDLFLTGFSHIVANPDHRANGDEFVFFRTSEQDALDFAVNLNPAESDSSVVGGWTGSDFDGTFTVGVGNLIGGGTQALSIAAAVNVAQTGNIVRVLDGTYVLNSTLNIDEGISLLGAGQGNTFIDASGVSGYGIHVTADGVQLSNFTLDGPSANVGTSYGIKVNPGSSARGDVIDGFWITGVTVRGSGRTELDLHAVTNATIDGFTADGQGTAGVGIGITDSANIHIVNSTTLDNAWGGVGLWQRNASYDQQLTDIVIDGSNSFGEANGVYAQQYHTATQEIGDLWIEGFDFLVFNDQHDANSDYYWFQRSQDDAIDFAVNVNNAHASVVGGWDGSDFDGTFVVGVGELLGGGTYAMSIGAAANLAEDGNVVRVLAGTYDGFGTSFGGASGVSFLGDAGATIDGSGVTGRIVDLRADGTTFSGFAITGDGTGVGVSVSGRGVTVADNTISDVLTGVQTTTQYAAGDAIITGNTISSDYGISLQNTGNTVSGNTVNAAVEGVGLLQGANAFSGNTFTIGAGGDALNLYGTASAADMTGADNTVTIAGGGLQGAVDLALDDGTVNVGDGTYAEDVLVSGVRTLLFGDVTVDGLTLDAGAAGSGVSGTVASTGDLTFAGDVSLLGDLDLSAAGDLAMAGVTGPGEDLTLSGATVSLGSATVGGLDITGATTLTGGSYVADHITIAGATTLTQGTVLDTSGVNGDVSLGSVDGASAGGQDLTVLAGTGDVGLGALGGSTALGAISVNGGAIQSVGANAIGAVHFNGLTVSLEGDYATGGGDLTVTGPVTLADDVRADTGGGNATLGTINGAWELDIDAGPGTITVAALGGSTALSEVSLTGGAIHTSGAVTTGDQSYDGATLTLVGAYATGGGDFSATGASTLAGATSVATGGGDLAMGSVNGGHALTLNAGGGDAVLGSMGATTRLGAISVTAASTVLNGNVYAGASLAFLGSDDDSTVRLTRTSTTFNSQVSASHAGDITIAPHLVGTAAGAQSVSFIAGSGTGAASANGDISIGDAGSNALRLGSMTVRGDDFSAQTVKLAGSYTATLTGNQTFSANTLDTLGNVNATVGGNESGPIIAGGSVNLTVGGTSTGSLQAGGSTTVTSGGSQGRIIDAGGPVNLTSGGGIGGSVTTPGTVNLQSAQNVNVQVNAGTVNVNAPGGEVTGNFTEITTDSGGTFVINGETVVGSGDVDARQFLADQFITPAGGVVGSTGQIQLPVGLAVALIAPAGEGEGQRRPIVVNSVERLGELLRLGYTAIIVQIDDGSEPEYEQELDIALEGEVEPVA